MKEEDIFIRRFAGEPSKELADLLRRLGGISPERVIGFPVPGTATVEDADRHSFCELFEGTLIEKLSGPVESIMKVHLGCKIFGHVEDNDLGVVFNQSLSYELSPGTIRKPDFSFIPNERLPGGYYIPDELTMTIPPAMVADFRVAGHSAREMALKREYYFQHGVIEYWQIQTSDRTIAVFTASDEFKVYGKGSSELRSPLLPGFHMSAMYEFEWAEDAFRPRSERVVRKK